MALNSTLIKSTGVAALGGLLFGFDTAVIAGATSALTSAFQLTPGGLGLTVSIALWGTVVGALCAGILGDLYGRRDSLRGLAILYLVSALGCAFATNWYALVCFRFIGGLAIGGSSVLGPMYIAEIAPARWRGRLVGFFQFNVVAGILLAYFSNYMVGLSLQGSPLEWRWKLGISALPAALFFLMLFQIPRSPRWLARKGRIQEARSVLEQIGEENVDSELQAMEAAFQLEKQQGQEHLFSARNRLPLFLAISIAMFNQLAGINAILYYLNDIFARAGFSKVSSDLQAVAIGATNLLFTMLAMSIIDIRPIEDVRPLLRHALHPHEINEEIEHWRHLTANGVLMNVELSGRALIFERRLAQLITIHRMIRTGEEHGAAVFERNAPRLRAVRSLPYQREELRPRLFFRSKRTEHR